MPTVNKNRSFNSVVVALLSFFVLAQGFIFTSPAQARKNNDECRGEASCLVWSTTDTNPWAVLLCVHGLGLHNGSYEEFGKRMADLGITTYAVDVRGFGSWQKAEGHETVDFSACMNDVKGALEALRRANPGVPVFIVGESMGGAIALQSTAKYPELIDGLISAVPAGDRFKQKKTELKVFLKLLTGPNKKFDIGSDVVDQATDDPSLRKKWTDDPLARMKLSPKELMQFQSFMNKNHEKAEQITDKPVLILQGGSDKLVKPEGTYELFNELKTKDKDLVMLGKYEHLILEEGQFDDQVIDVVTSWLDKYSEGDTVSAAEKISQERKASANSATVRGGVQTSHTVQQGGAVQAAGIANAQQGINPPPPWARLQGRRWPNRGQWPPPPEGMPPQQAGQYSRQQPPPRFRRGRRRRMMQRYLAAQQGLTNGPNAGRQPVPGQAGSQPGRQRRRGAMTHLKLAQMYVRMNNPEKAKQHFRQAVRLGRRSPEFARKANQFLLSLPPELIKPKTGPQTRRIAEQIGLANRQNKSAAQAPTVMVFCGEWSEPCKQLADSIARAKVQYGPNVQFMSVDVADPKNESLIEKYEVSPIPTILYLDQNKEVVSYTVGFPGEKSLIDGINKLLKPGS